MKNTAIGLTGGIGSGKSTVARILHSMGYPVYIADTKASLLMNSHPHIRQEIIRQFGPDVYTAQGNINKPLLAKIIFNDPASLTAINQIVHPRVIADFRQWGERQNSSLVFFESAILFEAGLHHSFHSIICVTAPETTRIQRVVNRDQTTIEQVKERIRNQTEDAEKCRQSDFILFNDEEHHLINQVLEILKKLNSNL